MLERYHRSGFVRLRAFPLLLAAMVLAALMSWPVQWFNEHNPAVPLNFFGTAGLGYVCGILAAFVRIYGHSRNPWFDWAVSITIGLGAVAASHYWAQQFSISDLMETPGAQGLEWVTSNYWEARSEDWSLGRGGGREDIGYASTILLWVLELLLIVGLSVAVGTEAIVASTPYCERSRCWVYDIHAQWTVDGASSTDIARVKNAQRLSELLANDWEGTGVETDALLFTIRAAEERTVPGFLCIEHVTQKKDGDQVTTVAEMLHENIIVPPAILADVKRRHPTSASTPSASPEPTV